MGVSAGVAEDVGPAEGEPGVETWAGDSWKRGGAPTWTTGAYDVESDTLFWTTGNPSPDWNGEVRKGDNLFSDSLLAVDPATGERKWHFQFTPHDVWDFDGNTQLFLVDVELGGHMEAWELRLTPRRPELAERLRAVVMHGREGTVTSVETLEASGDRSVMTLDSPGE